MTGATERVGPGQQSPVPPADAALSSSLGMLAACAEGATRRRFLFQTPARGSAQRFCDPPAGKPLTAAAKPAQRRTPGATPGRTRMQPQPRAAYRWGHIMRRVVLEEELLMLIGSATDGALLEIGVLDLDSEDPMIINAMPLRRMFYRFSDEEVIRMRHTDDESSRQAFGSSCWPVRSTQRPPRSNTPRTCDRLLPTPRPYASLNRLGTERLHCLRGATASPPLW